MTTLEKRIYLASRSPRRRELLRQIGIHFELLLLRETLGRGPADINETPLTGEAPIDYARRIARTKAETSLARLVQRKMTSLPVLTADTVVAWEGQILGKPESPEHAAGTLEKLAGNTHQVITAIALAAEGTIREALSVTTVRFRPLSQQEILAYVAHGEAWDKAGAYAIQGMAAVFVAEICGSYSGVMGLPLFETAALLKETGLETPF
jgi:septum formation protein